jgi:hypothetical protein
MSDAGEGLLAEVGNALSLPSDYSRSSLICRLRIDHMVQLSYKST